MVSKWKSATWIYEQEKWEFSTQRFRLSTVSTFISASLEVCKCDRMEAPRGSKHRCKCVSVRWCVCIDQYDYDERWFMPHLVRDEKCEPYWEDLLSEGSSPHHTENPLTAGQNPNQANYGTNSLYEPQSRENVTKPPGLPWKVFFFLLSDYPQSILLSRGKSWKGHFTCKIMSVC